MHATLRCFLCAACLLAALPLAADELPVRFEKHVLDTVFRSEGVAVADFTGNGLNDIAVGSVLYAAPDWAMIAIAEEPREFDPNAYSDVFFCFAHDVNGNGRPDLITNDIPGGATWWWENPGEMGTPWKRHLVVEVLNNESPIWVDLFGDGRPGIVGGVSPDPENPNSPDRRMAYVRPGDDPYAPWDVQTFSVAEAPGTDRYAHGLGVGDLNGNGRLDVVVRAGWWEQPEDPNVPEWPFHPADLGEPCVHMVIADFSGDGRADILTTSAHDYGVWWHRRVNDTWVTEEIDRSVSQTHAVILHDFTGNGLPDAVTGKRYLAHPPGVDPGDDEPSKLLLYALERTDEGPRWTRHVIDDDSGVGTQFELADVNDNGLMDIVVANKKGVFFFEQLPAGTP